MYLFIYGNIIECNNKKGLEVLVPDSNNTSFLNISPISEIACTRGTEEPSLKFGLIVMVLRYLMEVVHGSKKKQPRNTCIIKPKVLLRTFNEAHFFSHRLF